MKLVLLYTGGTIGMAANALGVLAPDPHFPTRLRALFPELPLLHLEPALDSASATPQNWQTLAEEILRSDAAAVVVLHGTDTLAYTAAALHHLLSGLEKTVVLTGSQRPLGAAHSDAEANLRGAIAAAREQSSGVSVFFGDCLFSGQSLRKMHSSAPQAFDDPHHPPLARWDGQQLLWNHQPQRGALSAFLRGQWRGFDPQACAVLWIYPDMPASAWAVLADERIRAVLLLSFGSGNLPEREDFHDALRRAQKRGVRLLNISQCPYGPTASAYASGAQALGIASAEAQTPESALVALHCALAEDL